MCFETEENQVEDKSAKLSTQELWMRLFRSASVGDYLEHTGDACEMPAFSEYISQLCMERNEKPESIIKRSNLDSSYGHRLFSGARNPSRDTVLQLAFGFGMDTDEAQQLLKIARVTALHPRVKRDAVIAYCLHHRINVTETQMVLYDHNLPLMGVRRNEG